MRKPFTPKEALARAQKSIPDEVIEAFEELILENLSGSGRAIVLQDNVVALAAEKLGIEEQIIFDRHWLDVEDLFRAQGWEVKYDKPGFNETYPATFEFRGWRKPNPRRGWYHGAEAAMAPGEDWFPKRDGLDPEVSE